ncbi:MAG: hypothetical protein KBT48_09935 [Firmicutes bacterium]|nr:hypothetical protein [Bacillota bacterium]
MWKYKCKSHLISLGFGFLIGVALTGLSLFKEAAIIYQMIPEQIADFVMDNTYLLFISGGFGIAGFVNVIFLIQYIAQKFNINSFFLTFVVMLAPTVTLMIGVAGVIPAIAICVYGIVSLNQEEKKKMANHQQGLDSEFVRVYSIHHNLNEEVKALGESCRKNADKVNTIYTLGIIAIICLTLAINNIVIWFVILALYLFAFQIVMRYKASVFLPITSLMYSQCDPEACISAIIYYSTKNGKVKLVQRNLIAQCLIYLDDPELAQDVLIGYQKKDQSSALQYWTIMSYIYYMMKDEDGIQRCKEEVSKIRLNFGGTGVIIQSGEMRSIQNRIDLLNGELNTCKKYFLDFLKSRIPLPFQLVDASYYIGLISFVQEDYVISKMYFEKVVEHGNKMNMVTRAQKYLDKIAKIDVEEDTVTI